MKTQEGEEKQKGMEEIFEVTITEFSKIIDRHHMTDRSVIMAIQGNSFPS